jgi:hypothetical protein
MKRGFVIFLFLVVISFSLNSVFAEKCNLQVSMINQDPYPALQGDYVKVVFQVTGVQNPECGKVEFELEEKYPISLDPSQNPVVTIDAGTYTKDFSSFLLVPYKIRVDPNALDGDNPIEVKYRYSGNQAYESKQFELNVQNTRADFEVHVQDYDPATNTITFEILNIGKSDIKALSVEVPKQDNIDVKGSNINIVGDLDSNEYVTADFEATPKAGDIDVKLTYTDSTEVRRTLEKMIPYDPTYFEGRNTEQTTSHTTLYVVIVVIVIIVGYFFYRRHKKKKAREKRNK